ncbi:MAG TPA: hypothetical protein VFT20_09485 [Candidatus Limnocylindrales bacterium]|nr:hypothetical protein [Candidatus Limnocylindrales bacterium]
MIYEQRAPEAPAGPEAAPDAPPWRPEESPLADQAVPIGPGDRYVAIDRIDGPLATLAVAPWPSVDPSTGRLDFGPRDERATVTVPLDVLQGRVDADRRSAGQLLRPIRPSDVFLVTGFGEEPADWQGVLDVTRAGRLAAKASLYATAAPAPHSDELEAYNLEPRILEEPTGPAPDAAAGGAPDQAGPGDEADGEGPATPPPGPVAYPAV